jgi:hypothetical protein
MTETKEAKNITLSDIFEYAEKANNEVRVIDKIEVNQAIRQGDVYLTRISTFSKDGLELTNDYKLAPGNTPGSRHFVEGNMMVWKQKSDDMNVVKNAVGCICYGPVIEAKESFKVTHPEHADFYMPPGNYQVSYQVDPVQMRRVLD